jgi:dipeptidyl aminopeptidase/acylaminoacyl peptidase
MRRVLGFLILLVLSLPPLAYPQKRGLMPQDYYKEVTLGEVALSPAGDLVAFTVTTIVEKENKRHQEIWMQRLRGGGPDGKPFRFTDSILESSSPRWSPDGTLLGFNSRRGKDANSAWFMRITAPGGEAFHIEGVEGPPVWSPDGKWIAYTKSPSAGEDEAEDRNKREGWIAPDAVSKTLDAKRFDGRVITSTRYKRDGTLQLMPHFSVRKKSQLFVVAAAGGVPRRITEAAFDVREIEWSRDSRILLFTGDERQDDESNVEQTSDIYAVSPEGGEARRLTRNPGGERAPVWAPNAERLAFLYTKDRGAETDIMVVDVAPDGTFRTQPKNLTASWDLGPGSPSWTPDGSELRFGAGVGGNSHLFKLSLDGNVRQITTGDRQLGAYSFSRDGKLMAYSATDVVAPTEAFVARGDGTAEQRLTSFNDSWLAEIVRMPAERLTWKVADGTQIEGWVVRPVDYAPGRKYPMVLKIHGGPHGAYGNTWFGTFHILSNAGFFVLYTNPRGSTGYGHKFTYATRGKWGEVDGEDFIKGVDAAIAKYPDIDRDRVGVSGGSYGGYMTAWLTSTTNRFAAAVASRLIVNWESWYGASDAQDLTEYEFLGMPWEQRDIYRRLSPLSYVEKVTAPTLLIEGEEDYRTPMAEGEQWFMALKKMKVPVELVRYPRSSHGLSRTGEPWLLVDRLERIRSWFVHYLIEQPARRRPD